MQLQIADKVSWKQMDDLIVVVDIQTGEYYSLNETAATIWQAIAEGKGREGARAAVLSKFDVDESAADQDVGQCIGQWVSHGIVKEGNDA